MCRCDGYTRCTEYSLPFRRDLFVSVIMLGIYRPEFARWNFILAKKILCTVFFDNNDNNRTLPTKKKRSNRAQGNFDCNLYMPCDLGESKSKCSSSRQV